MGHLKSRISVFLETIWRGKEGARGFSLLRFHGSYSFVLANDPAGEPPVSEVAFHFSP